MRQNMPDNKTIAGEYSSNLLHYLLHRRSVPRKKLASPGPTDSEVKQILEAAARVSDHGKMFPWWFIVFDQDKKSSFEDVLAKSIKEDEPDKPGEKVEKKAQMLMVAPVAIAVISSPRRSKIPVWEQFMSVGACCQNLVLAANAMGYGVNWLTEWYSYDPRIREALQLEDHENIAGFFFIGTAEDVPEDRDRPEIDKITTYWSDKNMVFNKGEEYSEDKNKFEIGRKGFSLGKDFED